MFVFSSVVVVVCITATGNKQKHVSSKLTVFFLASRKKKMNKTRIAATGEQKLFALAVAACKWSAAAAAATVSSSERAFVYLLHSKKDEQILQLLAA